MIESIPVWLQITFGTKLDVNPATKTDSLISMFDKMIYEIVLYFNL